MAKEVIAVDLGGTNLRVALIRNNKIIKYIKKKTPKNKRALLNSLSSSISELMNKNNKNVRAIGVSSAGPLSKGIIRNPPNLPLKNFNLKGFLQKKFKKKVEIENDANCVALAEAKLGCKKKNFFILTLGTGIGGGIIINNKLYVGEGYAGELGHIILHNGEEFENLAAWKRIRKLTKKHFKKELLVKDLIKMKNIEAKKILQEISMYLGQGIASLINVFDPEIVILTGGMEEAGSKFLSMIKKQTQNYLLLPKKTPITWSKLKEPGILGASLLFSD